MRTVFVHHTDGAIGVAKNNEIFTEHPRLDGGAVRFAHFLDQAHRCPVSAHQRAHWRIAFDAAEQLVLFLCEHFFGMCGCVARRQSCRDYS